MMMMVQSGYDISRILREGPHHDDMVQSEKKHIYDVRRTYTS